MSLITAVSGAPFARMLGIGSYSPARVVTNAEMCERIDSTDEWIRERSGITERRFAAQDETVADMAVAAASKALASAGITAALDDLAAKTFNLVSGHAAKVVIQCVTGLQLLAVD